MDAIKCIKLAARRCVYHDTLDLKSIILAGGLTPENVEKAIVEVRSAGVDSHIGVEDSSGRKSR
jgi:phosphoribosylanthranilate isomerase